MKCKLCNGMNQIQMAIASVRNSSTKEIFNPIVINVNLECLNFPNIPLWVGF